jgi:hypothetical protein
VCFEFGQRGCGKPPSAAQKVFYVALSNPCPAPLALKSLYADNQRLRLLQMRFYEVPTTVQ